MDDEGLDYASSLLGVVDAAKGVLVDKLNGHALGTAPTGAAGVLSSALGVTSALDKYNKSAKTTSDSEDVMFDLSTNIPGTLGMVFTGIDEVRDFLSRHFDQGPNEAKITKALLNSSKSLNHAIDVVKDIVTHGSLKIHSLVNADQFKENGEPKANAKPLSAAVIAEHAKADGPDGMAWRYALKQIDAKEFNAFVVTGKPHLYDQHNKNGELDHYNPATGKGMTDKEINERAAHLEKVLHLNIHNAQEHTEPHLAKTKDIQPKLLAENAGQTIAEAYHGLTTDKGKEIFVNQVATNFAKYTRQDFAASKDLLLQHIATYQNQPQAIEQTL
jgi:hypothetical protein